MSLSNDQVDALLAAVLATYSYSLEQAWDLRERLRAAGLCDPAFVAARDVEEIGNLLKANGYDRGGITYIIAPRVINLMRELESGRLDALSSDLDSNDKGAFRAHLETVKGFGPKSSELAWMLAADA